MNRLKDALSPYLLQHKDNPVDWYEWSDEAFDAAKKQHRPIFYIYWILFMSLVPRYGTRKF